MGLGIQDGCIQGFEEFSLNEIAPAALRDAAAA